VIETITVEPLSCQFSNENKEMGLRPHQHFAELTLTYLTIGRLGFPVFEVTTDHLRDHLAAATAKPFRDATNEEVARRLWAVFSDRAIYDDVSFANYGGNGYGEAWVLTSLELAVRGVPDDIGHSDGFARYLVAGP
jgi:hypothetical protein